MKKAKKHTNMNLQHCSDTVLNHYYMQDADGLINHLFTVTFSISVHTWPCQRKYHTSHGRFILSTEHMLCPIGAAVDLVTVEQFC